MASYIELIRSALVVFPSLVSAISSIFFIYGYRKHGTFLVTRVVILYSLVFYLSCTHFLVILPLPAGETVAQMMGSKMELRLSASWRYFRGNMVLALSEPSIYLPAMKQSVFLEPAFNVLLLIPFGTYLRYYFWLSFMKITIASFCLSLFFELTQLGGLYSIYPRLYHLSDVNDLVTNTSGGAIGFVVTSLFTFILLTGGWIGELSYEKGRIISLTRCLVAYLIDWTSLSIASLTAAIFFKLVFDSGTATSRIWWFSLEVGLYFMIVSFIANGWTLRKKVVRIRLVGQDRERISSRALIIRYGYLYFLFYGLSWLEQLLQQIINSTANTVLQTSVVFISLGVLLLQGIFTLNILLSFLRKKWILFYERASYTYIVSAIT